MARTALNKQQRKNIIQAKKILRILWKQSQFKQKDILAALEVEGISVKKNTLSNWLSETSIKRPPLEKLSIILQIIASNKSPEELLQLHQELAHLLGYQNQPESSESILNAIAQRLNQHMTERLILQRLELEDDWPPLLELLYEIEQHIFEYDRSFPVLRLDSEDIKRLQELLGKNKQNYKCYQVSEGYEIPLTQLTSSSSLTSIINKLHEGVRILRAYVEKNLLSDISPGDDYPLFEELLKYIWEIVNRLLFNPLCQREQNKKQILLSVIGTCQGIFYLLDSHTGRRRSVQFQNVLQLKGMSSPSEIQCSVAVYVGVVARQTLNKARKSQNTKTLKRSLSLFKEAFNSLEQHHQHLATETAIFYYKKEIANLVYDFASLLLWFEQQHSYAQSLMQLAHQYYAQVLETVNLFQQGLSEERALYLKAFYSITDAWCNQQPRLVLDKLTSLSPEQNLNETFWIIHLARAIAYGVLCFRFREFPHLDLLQAMQEALASAQKVSGMEQELQHEFDQDFILNYYQAPKHIHLSSH